MTLAINEIHEGDCLQLMKDIPDKGVDMILCDLPYGTTACKWDTIIPYDLLWEHYKRVIKNNGAIVLFGTEPFSSQLRTSNIEMYKYDWIWEKPQGVNFAQCNRMPMSVYETISVFGRFGLSKNAKTQPIYNPQDLIEVNKNKKAKTFTDHRPTNNNKEHIQKFSNYPRQVVRFPQARGLHPTQKPVELIEYLIRTYTNEGETILDNCIGSGTTAVAAINTNRQYIGIEMDADYVEIARNRINETRGALI